MVPGREDSHGSIRVEKQRGRKEYTIGLEFGFNFQTPIIAGEALLTSYMLKSSSAHSVSLWEFHSYSGGYKMHTCIAFILSIFSYFLGYAYEFTK